MSLNEYLTGIADAIRAKKGTNDLINAQNFATEIANLPSGGSSEEGLVLISNPNTISDNAYQGSDLISVIVPQNITSIGNYAFADCVNLQTAAVSSPTISARMFGGCTNLTDLVIGATVTTINGYAFVNCSSLKTVTLPSSVTSLDMGTFSGCAALETAIINSTAPSDGRMFENCKNLKKITYSANCSWVGSYDYYYCTALEVIDFRNNTSVATLSSYNAFYNANANIKIVVPDNLYDSWITSTNWVSVSVQFVKASEYTEE